MLKAKPNNSPNKGQLKQKTTNQTKPDNTDKNQQKTMLRKIDKSVYNIYIYREQSL